MKYTPYFSWLVSRHRRVVSNPSHRGSGCSQPDDNSYFLPIPHKKAPEAVCFERFFGS